MIDAAFAELMRLSQEGPFKNPLSTGCWKAEFLINIGYLEEELGKISGFDPDHVYWRRFKEKSIMKKSIPVEAVDG